MSRFKKSKTAAALLGVTIAASEGSRNYAYPDPGTHGVPWTICQGATKLEDGSSVKRGDYRTNAQCRVLLLRQTEVYADRVEACTAPAALAAMPDRRLVAFVSLAYNNGPGAYCSFIAPLVNAGRTREACAAMAPGKGEGIRRPDGSVKRFDTVMHGKVVMPGLTSRRKRERAMCEVDL